MESYVRVRVAAAFLAVGLSAVAPARAAEMNGPRFIEVSGEASLNATPDFARVTLGVTTTGKDAGDALAANAKAVAALVDLIKSEGVAPADIQTSSLSISPLMTNPREGSREARTIAGYTVSNMVTVTARDISKLGALIDKAVGAGANALYGISYGENDPGTLMDAVRPKAVEDARRKAEIFAKAGGARVGGLLSLVEEGGGGPVPVAKAYATPMRASTPIEAGEDRLTVSVTARFELIQ